jgi:Polyketide cyclase / dehydrase and lipid transport
MATIRTTLDTAASPDDAWAVIRDVGALHTRLAPGFIADTRLESGARVVTFANGMVAREPIVTVDDEARRLVWTAEGGRTTHYNAALEVAARPGGGAAIVWTADFLPTTSSCNSPR